MAAEVATVQSLLERLQPSHSLVEAVVAVQELRDQLDALLQPALQEIYAAHFLPQFMHLLNERLRTTEPAFMPDDDHQKVRNGLLEVVQRLPCNEHLKPYAPQLMAIIMETLKVDNEENGSICLRVLIELHKNYRHLTELEDYVQPFFDWVKTLLSDLPLNVQTLVDDPESQQMMELDDLISMGTRTRQQHQQLMSQPQSPVGASGKKALVPSAKSFKVLAECPIIFVLLFQIYKKFIGINIPSLVPLIVQAIGVRARAQMERQMNWNAEEPEAGMVAQVGDKAAYTELIGAQVKIVSFLAYIIRGFANLLQPHQVTIADSVINLLLDCPNEASATRKELLVALRHLLSNDFRSAFIVHIDKLFSESILVGTSITGRETLRPLAYSMLADLIHHVRQDLTTDQIRRTMILYIKNMHDPTLAPSIQTMCAKLLLNLIDCAVNFEDKQEGRQWLIRLLDAFVDKFTALSQLVAHLAKRYSKPMMQANDPTMDPVDHVGMQGLCDSEHWLPIHTSAVAADHYWTDIARDYKFLFKTLVLGLKAIVHGLRRCSPSADGTESHQAGTPTQGAAGQPAQPGAPTSKLQLVVTDEVNLFVSIFVEGLRCFPIFRLDILASAAEKSSTEEKKSKHSRSSLVQEEKEILEHFVTVFTLVDAAIFQEVMESQMDFFFDQLLEDPTLLSIAQYLLASEHVSRLFSGVLLQYLMARLEDLGGLEKERASLMLRLFKLVFMAITLFPKTNESILQPHMNDLILKTMEFATKAQDPNQYFLLLRALFRNIGGGRFELLYKEVLPLLPFLLKRLNAYLSIQDALPNRSLFVELCLTVPVRLSVLLPYLHYLVKPLVLALESGPELVSQGLRTLELCIDNLTSEFLDPILAPSMEELMRALWKHLKPLPYNQAHSHATMRILGKLGGRNRRIWQEVMHINHDPGNGPSVQLPLVFESNKPAMVISLDESLKEVGRIFDQALQARLRAELASGSSGSQGGSSAFPPIAAPDQQTLESSFQLISSTLPLLVDFGKPNVSAAHYAALLRNRISQPPTKESVESCRAYLEDYMAKVAQANSEREATCLYEENTTMSHREAQLKSLEHLLSCLFICLGVESLKERSWALIKNIVHHFSLLKVLETYALNTRAFRMARQNKKLDCLDANVFLEAVVKACTSKYEPLREGAEQILQEFYTTICLVFGSEEAARKFSSFQWLASKFCSACYRSGWASKWGGVCGIVLLTEKLNLGPSWILDHELEFVKALLFVMKDVSSELSSINMESIQKALLKIVKTCHSPETADTMHPAKRAAKRSSLLHLLIAELSNVNTTVRQQVRVCLKTLAEMDQCTVTELLTPVKDRLLTPIFSKPLRALPFTIQIGHIDAITFCLSLDPSLLEWNEELIRLLHEALALADADDQALTSKSTQLKNAVILTQLRTVCVQLLSAAIASQEFATAQKWNGIRFRIVQVFFKSLYSKADEVVDAAKLGLRQSIVNQNKLPKDLLQTGLRPILLNLSDHKRLTVDGLLGLGRLLEILTTYFKVEIGKKLLDHLEQWAQPNILETASMQLLGESHEVKLIASILDIIHLLPPAANMFMNDMVQTTLKLETALRRYAVSPFRPPLLRYLNRFPEDGVLYFVERMQTSAGRLLVDLMHHSMAKEFRVEVSKNIDKFAVSSFGILDANERHAAITNFIMLVNSLYGQELGNNEQLMHELRNFWMNHIASFKNCDKNPSIDELLLWRQLAKLWIKHLKQNPSKFDFVLDLLEMFTFRSGIDLYFIRDFFSSACCDSLWDADGKRNLILSCISLWRTQSVIPQKKISASRFLMVPLLCSGFIKNEGVLTGEILDAMKAPVWNSSENIPIIPESQYLDNMMKLEFLQLTALIIKYAATQATDYRKDIIKYAWGFLKHDDSITRQAAYVVLSYFIRSYETPPKIVVQIFVTLLRTHQSECRVLVKQALDILAPSLPERLTEKDETEAPTWVRWTKKILIEDGHVLAQLIAVWQLIIRHADLFYRSREQLIQYIVGSLAKLGLMPSATSDSRILTLDLVELVLKWEKRRVSNNPVVENSAMDVDDVAPKSKSGKPENVVSPDDAYIPNTSFREMIVNYLIRFLCTINEPLQKKGLALRIVELLKSFYDISEWTSLNIRTNVLERFFQVNDMKDKTKEAATQKVKDASLASVPSILAVLNLLITKQPQEWLKGNMVHIQVCLETCLSSENVQIIDKSMPVLASIFKAIKDQEPDLACLAPLLKFLGTFTSDGLMAGRNIYGIVMSLQTVSEFENTLLDSAAVNLCKLFHKLCKDYTTVAHSPQGPIPTVIAVICAMVRLLNKRISQLGDVKKSYANGLVALMDKSDDAAVHQSVFEVIDGWMFEPGNTSLTAKEKSFLALRFASSEHRCDKAVFEKFLLSVLKLYSQEAFLHSELTVRLEPVFLVGMRWNEPKIRSQFISRFERNLPKSLFLRFSYILGVQNWEFLANTFWIRQALDVLLAIVKVNSTVPKTVYSNFLTTPLSMLEFEKTSQALPNTDPFSKFLDNHLSFLSKMCSVKIADFMEPLKLIGFSNHEVSHGLWVELFTLSWESFSSKEQHDLSKALILMLTKDYHMRQADLRPNVPQVLLDGAARCGPPMLLPPQVVKYLAKKCNAWYEGLSILDSGLDYLGSPGSIPFKDVNKIRESTLDAKCELYTLLSHYDWFYGLWRRRCMYPETNAALSYEQVGMWQQAQAMYESAQVKARNGVLPFSEHEYGLWEDRWISCTQKLQQWDILMDLSKADKNVELQLECAWRIVDWSVDRDVLQNAVALVSDRPNPRLKTFEAFLLLSNLNDSDEKMVEMLRVCDEGIQLALRDWHALPDLVSQSHTPILHTFQQFLELQEASRIYKGIGGNSRQNKLDSIQELKGTLGTWRDRLPNIWDDINIWSELVAWRQHVFSVINKAYQPLAEQQPAGNSLAYRGYHEIAWIINRFAHVARKHHLVDVCINALTKIYTLPNIEIHDAFLKLREQAKCYIQNPNEYITGLEVINNTNLGYFQNPQRAEFFTLKGIFLGKLKMTEEANAAFSAAIHIDMKLAKGWAAWGQYNDQLFTENPRNYACAANAVGCYLQAIGLYKNARSRKLIARVLWLLGQDDAEDTIAKAFEAYKEEIPTWYWITFIPQLLNAMSRKEARLAKNILVRIAKSFPQSLYFYLRTARKELMTAASAESRSVSSSRGETPTMVSNTDSVHNAMDADAPHPTDIKEPDSTRMEIADDPMAKKEDAGMDMTGSQSSLEATDGNQSKLESSMDVDKKEDAAVDGEFSQPVAPVEPDHRTPAEHVDEVLAILKTAFPLLALSIETMVDQILTRLKPSGDEDMYRVTSSLLTEGMQQLLNRVLLGTENEQTQLTLAMLNTFERFLVNANTKNSADEDFARSQPTLEQLVVRFRQWRERMEGFLDNRPRKQNLEHLSHYLIEFEYQRFDEVEVPGQYLTLKDGNTDFVKVDRFYPEIQHVRGYGVWYRRFTVIGHDGSTKHFLVQNPCARHSRREERVLQLFRLLNGVLVKRKETRQRNLSFHMPVIVPLSANARIVEDDPSNVSLQDIYEDHCDRMGFQRDDPIFFQLDLLKGAMRERGGAPFPPPMSTATSPNTTTGPGFSSNSVNTNAINQDLLALKTTVYEQTAERFCTPSLLTAYFARSSPTFMDLWMLRLHVTHQLAVMSFLTHVMCIGHRLPHKLQISRQTGHVTFLDLLPLFNTQLMLSNPEPVPFRLTPCLQHWMGVEGVEGVWVGAMGAMAMNLDRPEFELSDYAGLVVRDEVASLQKLAYPDGLAPDRFQEKVQMNMDGIQRRVHALNPSGTVTAAGGAAGGGSGQVDASSSSTDLSGTPSQSTPIPPQSILELISEATHPQKLGLMDAIWHPWL